MRSVGQILDDVLTYGKLKNDAALARELGIKPNTVSMWRKRDIFDYKLLITYCEQHNIPIGTILTGQLVTKYINVDGKKVLTTAGEPELYKLNNSHKEHIVCEPPPVSYNNNITPEIQPVIDAVIEVMTSDNEIFKTALTQNAFAFQLSVRSEKKVSKLENDIKEIKRVLGTREDDFKTLGPQGEKKQGGGNG